ncbi:hypothetical protein E4U09_001116 [Claviceps aff. purpurea]|uniref:Uncharacterized protein n=1 Tax=Claviceps aff. purpurea TaxID=1967640 RepID=A0A9P7QIC0_9HYPO|nr:hypothetical protein E4U09_001116 [Claviceps aff. purpurea]
MPSDNSNGEGQMQDCLGKQLFISPVSVTRKIEEGRWMQKAAKVLTRPQLHTKTMIDGKDSKDSSPPWTTTRPDN